MDSFEVIPSDKMPGTSLISLWYLAQIFFEPAIAASQNCGSQEHFRVKYNRGFVEFGVTGKYTIGLLTQIFKARVPTWHMVLEARASRDAMNVIEIRALAEWEPGQDLSHDNREVTTPARIVEERGRGTVIKNEEDVQRLLDYQAAMQREIKVGI
jgi:hypothetical protein